MHSLKHLENIIGTPASVCWGERGSSVEEEEKKRGSVRGDVTLTPPYATPGLRKAAIIIPIT